MVSLRNHRMALCFYQSIRRTPFTYYCPLPVCEKSQESIQVHPSKTRSFCNGTSISLEDTHPIDSSAIQNRPRVSRLNRSAAQRTLFEYLHYTRGLSFLDAEYISKNSPRFIQKLLSNIDTERDVSRSLEKLLMYNPINEYEPFFESVGLSQPELQSFLPKDLFFLNDDRLLLNNFHVICNYGIPKSKIGKIFKEAKEIFWYEDGVLDSKLLHYQDLGLSRSTIAKLVVCSPSLLIGDNNLQFLNVLERLKELGIDSASIGKHLSEKHEYNWCRILETIEFLEKVFDGKEQMAKLFPMSHALVLGGSGKKIYLLFSQFLKLGVKMQEIGILIAENPQVLSPNCARNLAKAMRFLLNIEMDMDVMAEMVSNHMKLLCSRPLKGYTTVCKELNVTSHYLRETIKEDPIKLFHLASKVDALEANDVSARAAERHKEKVTFLSRLGFIENSEEMAKASKEFRGRGDQLQERFDCFVKAGLDVNVVSSIVKHAPMMLNQSTDMIVKKIDYLTNHLGYPLETITAFPTYMCYDMQRINQRFSMYLWLKDRGKAKKRSLSTMLACSDARFVKYFVDVDPEGPAMWETLKQSS